MNTTSFPLLQVLRREVAMDSMPQSTWLSFPDHQSWYVHKIYTRLPAKRKAALFIRVFNSPTTLLSLIPLCLSLSLSNRCKGESKQFYIINYLPTASSFVFLFSKQIWSMSTKIIFHKTRKKETNKNPKHATIHLIISLLLSLNKPPTNFQ